MKVVKLKGGLGNQMFQYAYARLLGKLCEDDIRLDYSAYKDNAGDTVRVPRINEFNIVLRDCTETELKSVNYFRHVGKHDSLRYKAGIWFENKINKKYYLAPREYVNPELTLQYSYYDGYWQNVGYVEPVLSEISAEFTPRHTLSDKTQKMIDFVSTQNSVFVGVRKGDYSLEKKHYGSFGSDYYQKAMGKIAEAVINPVFYVFSNDIEWCKKNLEFGKYNVIYREPEEQTSDFEELVLLSNFKHAVIINSTFHWWGAYLMKNPEKVVCCPSKWFFDNCRIDIYPDSWIKI